MKYTIIVMPQAEDELDDSAAWWRKHRSAEQAAKWYSGISAAIETLAENPRRCPMARENQRDPEELRELHFGLGRRPTHRVLFTIRESDVVIVAVRHAAQGEITPEELEE